MTASDAPSGVVERRASCPLRPGTVRRDAARPRGVPPRPRGPLGRGRAPPVPANPRRVGARAAAQEVGAVGSAGVAGVDARCGSARPSGSRTAVRLYQSALVQVPTALGWLRPVILMPAGALVGLSTAQLELVLAHELAHIRRRDYLVNLLQTAVETLLFYHPAVWWVSGRMRDRARALLRRPRGRRLRQPRRLRARPRRPRGPRGARGPVLAMAASGGIALRARGPAGRAARPPVPDVARARHAARARARSPWPSRVGASLRARPPWRRRPGPPGQPLPVDREPPQSQGDADGAADRGGRAGADERRLPLSNASWSSPGPASRRSTSTPWTSSGFESL